MVLAHAGHWLVDLAYAAPVVALVVWVGVARARDARRRRDAESARDSLRARSD